MLSFSRHGPSNSLVGLFFFFLRKYILILNLKLSIFFSEIHGVNISVSVTYCENVFSNRYCILQFFVLFAVDTFSAIHTMYKKEHSLKQKLVQFVAHAETRNTLMFYLSAWSHEPYLNCNDLLESLLFETGHR